MEQLIGIAFSPMLILMGIFATFVSPFSWVFIGLCLVVVVIAGYRYQGTVTSVRQWALGIFLTSFWFAHLVSEGRPTIDSYPCGRVQGSVEIGCEVWSTAGFPLPALHYFPAGDVPHIGMWPNFFLNALMFATVTIVITRLLPKSVINHNLTRKLALAFGVFFLLVGQATVMLRFD